MSGYGGFCMGPGRAGGVRVRGAAAPVQLGELKFVILKSSLGHCNCLEHLGNP